MPRVVLWGGFAFFLLVVTHIVFKRVPFLAPLHPLYYRAQRLAAQARSESLCLQHAHCTR